MRISFNHKLCLYFLSISLAVSAACSLRTKPSSAGMKSDINRGLIPKGGQLKFCNNWSEFVAAAESASPGDVIQLKNGVYSGNISFSRSGTINKPITIIPEGRGQVIINGNAEWTIDGKYIIVDGFYFYKGTSTKPVTFSIKSSYSSLLNTAVVDWNLGGRETKLITVKGSHNEVGYCVLRKKNTSGMMLEVVRESAARNDHNIHHCYFSYFKDPGSGNGFETVRISTSGWSLSSSYTTLENCVFERCDGEPEIISSKSGHNTFRNNTFLNSNGALTLRHGHDALVEGNTFISTIDKPTDRCTGVRIIGERHVVRNNYFYNLPTNSQAIQVEYGNTIPHLLTFYDQVKDVLIENNTLYNCDKGIMIGKDKRPSMKPPRTLPPNGIFRNNLIYSTRGSNNSLEIDDEVLADKLFSYTNNVIGGKPQTQPSLDNLPAGIKYTTDLKPIKGSDGLYRLSQKSDDAGVQNRGKGPLYPEDVVPGWVKLRMQEKDPAFADIPW